MTTRDRTDFTTVDVEGAPAIPGLRFRRFDGDADFARLAELMSTANLIDGIDELPDEAILRSEFAHQAGFEPSVDVIVAEVDGRLVGFGEATRSVRAGRSVYSTNGIVHPDWRRRGIGRAILRHDERRLREIAAGYDDPGGRVLNAWIDDDMSGVKELLAAEGYRPVRYGFAMRRPTLDDLPDAPLPSGLEVRPVRPEDHRRIWDADADAFADHWEARERTEEDFVGWFTGPYLDTSLWRVAWDGDEVAGSVMATIWANENEQLGVRRAWLDHISVRRPWRRRGLATALIVDALRGVRDVGMDEAMLGVDGENPHDALGLYESLGFVVKSRGSTWRKDW